MADIQNILYKDIEYRLDTEANRLERTIDQNTTLVSLFWPSPFGSNEIVTFFFHDGKCIQDGQSPNYNKRSSREDYLQNQRPPILEHVSIGHVLKIRSDILDLFEKKKEFQVACVKKVEI